MEVSIQKFGMIGLTIIGIIKAIDETVLEKFLNFITFGFLKGVRARVGLISNGGGHVDDGYAFEVLDASVSGGGDLDNANGIYVQHIDSGNLLNRAIWLDGEGIGSDINFNDESQIFQENGDLIINNSGSPLIVKDLVNTYTGGSAYVCVYDNGTLFASEVACP